MSRVIFLGAGASVDDGYPVTSQLLYPVVSGAMRRHTKKNEWSRLFQFLEVAYGVRLDRLKELDDEWLRLIATKKPGSELPKCSDVPDIIEILSQIDVAIDFDMSFGPALESIEQKCLMPRALAGRELRDLRREMEEDLGAGLAAIGRYAPRNTEASRLVGKLKKSDAMITTNWDSLLDRAIYGQHNFPDYGSRFVETVNLIPAGHGTRRLFKLHGSLNWLYCQRCRRLYVNQRADIAILDGGRGGFDEANMCDCGDRLRHLMVAPSYSKSYENVHIASAWTGAAQALMAAEEWLFAGYSFPSDDLMVRSLLIRCLAMRRDNEKRPSWDNTRRPTDMPIVKVFMHSSTSQDVLARPRLLFGAAMAEEVHTSGFSGLIDSLSG